MPALTLHMLAQTTAAAQHVADALHHAATTSAATATLPIAPALILVLCVVAGIGTVFLLPSRRDASFRVLGATILTVAVLVFLLLLFRWTTSSPNGGMGPYFWVFAITALFGALRVVTHTKPVYSALYFVLTVFASAGLFLLLRADFMAAALVLIYAGAILITYVFVIMLASEASTSPAAAANAFTEHDRVSRDPLIVSAVGFALMGVLLFVIFDKYQQLPQQPQPTIPAALSAPTQALGYFLFNDQLVNLEVAGLILTLAMVGAIVISRRQIYHEDQQVEFETSGEVVLGPATPIDDNPHSIPVYGTNNPRQKAFPER